MLLTLVSMLVNIDQNVRGATVLPNGIGRDVRVAVFTQGANAEAAKEAGARIRRYGRSC